MARARTRGPRGAARTAGARGDCRGGATATCFLVRAKNIIFAPFRRIQRTDPDLFDRRLPNKHCDDARHDARRAITRVFRFRSVPSGSRARRVGGGGSAAHVAARGGRDGGPSGVPHVAPRRASASARRRRVAAALFRVGRSARPPPPRAPRASPRGVRGPGRARPRRGVRAPARRALGAGARTAWTSPTERCSAAFAGWAPGLATRPLAQGDAVISLPTHAASADRPRDDANDAAPPAAPVPLVMTTRAVIDRDGPLGRLARALHAAGLVAEEEEEEEEEDEEHRDRRHPLRRRRDGFSSDSRRARLSRRLGGVVREGDHELPLDVSRASILALGILRTCAEAAEAPKRAPGSESPPRLSSSSPASSFHAHWRAYADLLPRETDALLEWSDEELDALQGSPLARRAKDRRAIVDAVYDEAVTELLAIDPGLFGSPARRRGGGRRTSRRKATLDVDEARRKKKPAGAAAESTSYASREAFRVGVRDGSRARVRVPGPARRDGPVPRPRPVQPRVRGRQVRRRGC